MDCPWPTSWTTATACLDVLHLSPGLVLLSGRPGYRRYAMQGDVASLAHGCSTPALPRPAPARLPRARCDLTRSRDPGRGWLAGPATRARVHRDRLRCGEPVAGLRVWSDGPPVEGAASDAARNSTGAGVDVMDLLEQRLTRDRKRGRGGNSVEDLVRPGPADLKYAWPVASRWHGWWWRP
ncbi:hypothetical protein HBB16_07650 [Pseudonocardia sp. MCCB 268]|nr:hypothetical protein [Pseudonocardia cytotoxica]